MGYGNQQVTHGPLGFSSAGAQATLQSRADLRVDLLRIEGATACRQYVYWWLRLDRLGK